VIRSGMWVLLLTSCSESVRIMSRETIKSSANRTCHLTASKNVNSMTAHGRLLPHCTSHSATFERPLLIGADIRSCCCSITALLDRSGQASMRRRNGTIAQIVHEVVRRVEPGGRSRTSIARQVCDALRRLIRWDRCEAPSSPVHW
jgi:hypothetical protein